MIQFKPVQRNNPRDKDAPMKYYPQLKKTGEIDFKTIAEELSNSSTLNIVDMRAVLYGLQNMLIKYLKNGYTVKFGDLGNFRPSLGGSGEDTPELLTANHVSKVKIIFSPSPNLKEVMKTVTLKKVNK